MTKTGYRELVIKSFPYSSVQPFLESLIKYGEYTPVQSPVTPEHFEGRVIFDIDKFYDELTDRL